MVYTINAQSHNDQGKADQKLGKWWNMSVLSALVRCVNSRVPWVTHETLSTSKNSKDTNRQYMSPSPN